jgi:ribosomal protein L10
MSSNTEYCITIRFQAQDCELAQEFAVSQPNAEKNQQVYRNTLAVLAVNTFVQELRYETDLDAGESWHPVLRMFHNVADLVLPGIGKIECCPVMLGETAISLPEVRENRIAYVAVGFAEPFDKVKLLGFIPAVEIVDENEAISLANLQPIEELLDYLDRIELGIPVLQVLLEEVLSDLAEDDPVQARVREKLQNKSIAEMAAILNQVLHSSEKSDWGYEGGKALAGIGASSGGLGKRDISFSSHKSSPVEKVSDMEKEVKAELNLIAEDLLEKLAEIWGD